MLVLAVHTVAQVTAKVAFSTILLQDFITNKKVPSEFKCRQLVPTSGSKSISLWDVLDPEALLAWLNENISVDCEHEVFEVQEDFGVGMAEVQRQRAADKVAKGVGAAASGTVHAVQDIDNKLRISERTANAVEAVKESAVVQSTAAALTKAGSSVKSTATKVLDQPAVASATEAVGSGFRKLGQSLSSFGAKVIPGRSSTPEAGEIPVESGVDNVEVKRADPPPPPPTAAAAPIHDPNAP